MRRLSAIAFVIVLLLASSPAFAQTTFTQGVWQFEDYIASMTYTGTWTTGTTVGEIARTTATAGGSVTFLASGKHLVIWRLLRSSGVTARYNICIGASCTAVVSESSNTDNSWVPSTFPLAAGTNTVSITQTSGTVHLDYFMILSDPSSAFPTAVPTATIIPSSTPASTTTPQPTPTPQPTSTPISVIWAIDPEKIYGSVNGQITSTEYSATAADIHLGNLLTLLLFSMWGMFFFGLFVLVRYKKK